MKKYTFLLIPFISVVVSTLLIFTSLDNKVADLFQRALPDLHESDNVIMVNIDDSSVNAIGTWPFSREVYADSLVILKDLGAEAAVFDLSFLDKSQTKVNKDYVESELPHYVDEDFTELSAQISWLMNESEGADISEDITGVMDSVQNRIKTAIQYSIRDVDEALANDLKFFENSYLTLTFDDGFPPLGEVAENYLSEELSLKNISVARNARVPSFKGVEPAISDFLFNAKKAGFVNAPADKDGFLRRLYLVFEYKGNYYPQLLFAPILNYLGNPKVEVYKHKIVLKDCQFPDGTRDVKIPLAQDGSVIIKYPPKSYYDYKSITLWSAYRINLLEKDLVNSLKELSENGFFSFWEGDLPYEYYEAAAGFIHDALVADDEEAGVTYDDYYSYKQAFYDTTKDFLYGSSEADLIASVEDDEETAAFIADSMKTVREIYEELVATKDCQVWWI